MTTEISNPWPGDKPPSNMRSVLLLVEDEVTGKRHMVRAFYARIGQLDDFEGDCREPEWIEGDPFWPEGWYEDLVAADGWLTPLDKFHAVAWAELPVFTFETPEER